MRPASSGSLVKSMPGTTCAVQNATCSVSAKKLSGIAVQHQLADRHDRHELFRHDLGRVEHVEGEAFGLLLGEDLQPELPLGIGAGLDRLPQIAAMKVGIGAGDLHRLVPHQRVRAGARRPVELDEVRFAGGVDQPEGVHAEALHRPVAARDGAIGHRPHQHRGDLGHQRREVPERVVRGAGLRHREVRLGLGRVDQVGKLHRVLDEEDRDVVADQIPVALVGVELHREAAHVARGVGRAALAEHGREADEHRRLLAGLGEERGARVLVERLVALEVAVRRRAARVDDALGDPLVVEVGDLLAEDEVLEQRRPAQAGLERVLVVADRHALVGGQRAARWSRRGRDRAARWSCCCRSRVIRCRPCPSRSSR